MAKSPKRRRCCECREWYRPELTTTKTQMTCSKECRLRRRRRQAVRRRELHHEKHLAHERERQRKHRRKAAAPQVAELVTEPVTEPVTVPVTRRSSRAGLSCETPETKRYPSTLRASPRRLSRAGLVAEMTEIKGLLRQMLGHLGQDSGPVTGRVDSQKTLNSSG